MFMVSSFSGLFSGKLVPLEGVWFGVAFAEV